jgi:hypothetical protein
MDENKVARDQDAKDQVEANRCGVEVGKKSREGDRGEKDSSQKGSAVTVVEVVPGFEASVSSWIDIEKSGVHQTISSIERPDSESHGECRREGKMDVVGRRNEPGPECGNCWGVEREKMPESKGV